MQVILKSDIKGVGKKDQVINASDGYARNFLFPKGLAVEANNENMSKLRAKQNSAKFQKDQEKEEAKKTAEKLAKISVRIKVKVGENGKIFGGVSTKEIAQELEKQYAQLLANFPNSIKIICIPFWPDKNKQNVITKIAVDNNVYLVDLSHLGNGIDKKNYASSYRKYKQPGVGEHPGDYGMRNIANNLFTVINCTMK